MKQPQDGPKPVNLFEEVQQICREFRRALKNRQTSRIEDHVNRIVESARPMLFQNLLHMELEYRRRAHKSFGSDEYIHRFPQFTSVIRQVFFESTMMSVDSQSDSDPRPEHDSSDEERLPDAGRLGDYQLIRELGRGGFGVVYEAHHVQHGNHVALKTLPTASGNQDNPLGDAERLHKFRREFRALCEVNHPNLVGMQTLEVVGDQRFITMDLIDGVDFLAYVRPKGRLDLPRLRQTLAQLFHGIVALHDVGVVHCDLKPSNVLVDADGHVVILDFGLASELHRRTDSAPAVRSTRFAGTPHYVAPEQSQGIRSTAGDWYSLGVMMYEALTDQLPMKGSGYQFLAKKRNEDAPRLVGKADVPQDLAELVDRLLQRDPRKRPGPQEIALALEIENRAHRRQAGDSNEAIRSSQMGTSLIGRESQWNELQRAYDDFLATREPAVIFIRGLSGEGKTTLAEKFLDTQVSAGKTIVVSGRCYDRESVPFKAIDCLIDSLVNFLRGQAKDEVLKLLPDDVHFLAHQFPVLRRIPAIADRAVFSVAGIESRQIRYRAFGALRELLSAISRTKPVILFVDDLQWGDADSAAAIVELLMPSDPPAVMLLGGYRRDEAQESPFLNEWRVHNEPYRLVKQWTVDVNALTEEQCIALIAERTGSDRDDLRAGAADLFASTQGNPYILEQLIEGFDSDTGRFQAAPLDEIIHRKLARLPSEAASLLEAIAVAGQAVRLDEVAKVVEARQAFATITHMRSERLLRPVKSPDQQWIDTYHDKIRKTVLDAMTESRRRELHVRFGEILEQQQQSSAADIIESIEKIYSFDSQTELTTSGRLFDLAYHFHAASDARGFAYQLMAGELSFQADASDDAIEFLKRASASIPDDASDAIQYHLWDRLASTYARQQQFEAAFEIYHQAIETAPSELARAQAYAGIGTIYQSMGHYTRATESYDLALREAGRRRPRSIWAAIRTVLLGARIMFVPASWLTPSLQRERVRDVFELKIYTYMTQYVFEQSNALIDYPYSTLRMGALSMSSAQRDAKASGLSFFAAIVAVTGWPGIARRLLRPALKIVDQVADAEMKGISEYALGLVHANGRELQLAHDKLENALPLLLKAGSHMFAHSCAHVHRHVYAVIGSSRIECAMAAMVLRLAEQVGDVRGQCWGHYDVASGLARSGDIESAWSRIETARSFLTKQEMTFTETIFLGTEGYVLLQASDYASARESLERSWRLIKKHKVAMEYNLRSVALLIESMVGPDWTSPVDPQSRKRLKRRSLVAKFLSRFYANLQSPIERARGRVFSVLGDHHKAIRCFQRAVSSAEALGADYDLARSLLDLAAIQKQGREEHRIKAVQLLKKQESVIPHAERWLLGDQYDERCVAPPARLEVQS